MVGNNNFGRKLGTWLQSSEHYLTSYGLG